MSYSQKNIVIKLVIFIVVIASSLLNGRMQINRKIEKIESVFMVGENEDNLSIYYDLTKIDDSMSYTISLAKANQQENNQYIQKIDSLHKRFSKNHTIKEYNEWYKDVEEVYPLALSHLESISLSNEHQKMLSKYKATYNSSIHTIAYSPYNEYVRLYNKETGGFIAKIIKAVTKVREVTTFD